MTSFGDAPASLYDIAARNARDEFREPRVFTHLDNTVMATVALFGLPDVAARFEADWEPFVQRIHAIDREPFLTRGPSEGSLARGDAMLVATLGLRVVRGGLAA